MGQDPSGVDDGECGVCCCRVEAVGIGDQSLPAVVEESQSDWRGSDPGGRDLGVGGLVVSRRVEQTSSVNGQPTASPATEIVLIARRRPAAIA
jgi:hypothetical protein